MSHESVVETTKMDPKARYMIDVGGFVYCSSIETLSKCPTLKAMIDTSPEDGSLIFIDRDGSAFQYILNFLRNGSILAVDDRAYTEFLIIEAGFFGLRTMESQLSKQLSERSRHDVHDIVMELRSIKLNLQALTDHFAQKRM